ncbi:uncharacterized protein PFB0145c [Teleopsis dalmanni]|uniref:uncharacterized protein PFB0145c n=1 Tax=Teleopsis dalmanni TaxID=139649 RepID=UPI0018CCBB41|nr:uncharacterized protein PFB0145c [Teleopsis dalmanni]
MGSSESTLPTMEDTNSESTTTQNGSNGLDEVDNIRAEAISLNTEVVTNNEAVDDPWWWEIENENLVLDQVANIRTLFRATEYDNQSVLQVSDSNQNNDNDVNSNENNCDIKTESEVSKPSDSVNPNVTNLSLTSVEVLININDLCDISERSEIISDLKTDNVKTPREQTLEEFKEELRIKRMKRQTAVQDLRDEISSLRAQLATEQAINSQLRSGESVPKSSHEDLQETVPTEALSVTAKLDTDDVDPMSRGRHANIELANAQLALQLANSENISLRTELGVVQKQVFTLKEVISCCKQMLSVKEEQCTQLKGKLQEIETSFGEREMKIMSQNLRQEYERQLGNIRQLRQLYEERQRISAAEQENLQRLISIKKDELVAENEKTKNFEERNQTLVKEVESAHNELATLREECNEHKFEKRTLKEEMGAVNTLFTQMLMGFNGQNNLDIDRLTTMLEENRTLLNEMTMKEVSCNDGATLPKLLFELVEQATVGERGKDSLTSTLHEIKNSNDKEHIEQDISVDSIQNPDVKGNNSAQLTDTETEATSNIQEQYNNNKMEQNEDKTEEQNSLQNIICSDTIGGTAICNNTQDRVSSTSSITSKNLKKYNRGSLSNKTPPPSMSSSAPSPSSSAPSSSSSSSATLLPSSTLSTMGANMSTMLKFNDPEVIGKVASAQEIIGNLPKVWKVLMELLSHHKIEQVNFEENGKGEDCYKSVETPNGPKTEISVSKTYIKLKDLILEKKSLVKETNRLKTLNCHLEYRLNEQEKRLSAVSLELTKTWHLVGKMQRQHRQLHTQEQILRYQLQQKRRLLSELKDELEYCRRKWAAARAKNDESQEQWNDLRREFAKRKLEDANNSAESGYSDSGPVSDEEERAAALVRDGSNNCRAENFKELFEHTRKIKRMQSTSPGRAGYGGVEIVLRWNSAPPTCGWRTSSGSAIGNFDDDEDLQPHELPVEINTGAKRKVNEHCSRSKYRSNRNVPTKGSVDMKIVADDKIPDTMQCTERASRIERLEEQCKTLIQRVLETSDNRERLEIQLCQFQDEISPVQYAVPLDEFISKKRTERMTRASSAPATGTLTPREEEYTRKRSERLERLEEESRQLMSRIKRTSDRGHYLRCSLDRIRRAPSREESFESNTEEDTSKVEGATNDITKNENEANIVPIQENESPLTATEESYTTRRAARLKRLEEQSKELLTKMSLNTQRGNALENKLDTLHEHYGVNTSAASANPAESQTTTNVHTTVETAPTLEEKLEDIEKITNYRQERLRILEQEGKELLTRLSNTSERGTRMINRITQRENNRNSQDKTKQSSDTSGSMETDQVFTTADITPTIPLTVTPNEIASTSIVPEGLAEGVTVTTTALQVAAQQGAIPKVKPLTHLCVSRRQAPKKPIQQNSNNPNETLEEMVKRLQALPFPQECEKESENKKHESEEDEHEKK